MKKFLVFLFSAVIVLSLFSVKTANAQDVSESDSTSNDLANRIERTTQEICDTITDRTAFTSAGEYAAEWIAKRLKDLGIDNVKVQEFSEQATKMSGLKYETVTIYGHNVTAFLDFGKKDTVLFSVPLSNHYSANEGMSGTKAEGALYYATSVAFALELAKEYKGSADCPYNVAFAFVAGTDEGNFGSKKYIQSVDYNLMLVVNVERIGCGTTYFYAGERKSELSEKANSVFGEYDIKEFPYAGKIWLPMEVTEGAEYSTYAMRGDYASYVSAGYSTLGIIGGDFSGGVNSEGGEYVGLSSNDTFMNLKKNHANYCKKIAVLINALKAFLATDGVMEACVGADESYKIFTKTWLPYTIALSIAVICGIALTAVVNVLNKKYKMPPVKKIKVAVFGREFEDGNEDYIDEVKYEDDIFDGR